MTDERTRSGERIPLIDRVNGEWTVFEATLFNLFTACGPKVEGFFSARLQVVQAMLDAMDAEVAVINAKWAAQIGEDGA